MTNETDEERINYLEKRVEELQKKLATTESPGIFLKVLLTLILAGTCFIIWKRRTFFKWAILALIAWLVFAETVTNIFSNTGNFFSTTCSEWKANDKVEDEHERAMERMRVEAETANSRTKAEADARTQIIQTKEAAKQAEWERGQAERRNDAVNDAIRGGHWHSNTPIPPPEVTAPPAPEIAKPAEPATPPVKEGKPESEDVPNVTVKSTGRQPQIERTVHGNTTRVVVRF